MNFFEPLDSGRLEIEMKQTQNSQRNTTEREKALQVLMPQAVWQKMIAYVKACDCEINGFGYVRVLDQQSVKVEDVFILKQTVSAGSAVTEPSELTGHITQMVADGLDTSLLRFQWHSHVYMPSYFSGIDTNTIDAYTNCDWMISLVVNKHEEFAIRLDVYCPFRLTVPVELAVFVDEVDAISKACAQEVKEKVRTWSYPKPALRRHNPKRKYETKKGAYYDVYGELWRPTRDIRPF